MPIDVLPNLIITDDELEYETGPASGPGGQHVNKTSSRVTLIFDVARSRCLSEAQKSRIFEKLASRISKDGRLRVSSQDERSQSGNRKRAEERLAELLRGALHIPKKRRPTRATRGSVRRRLENKRQRSDIKKNRSRKPGRDD